MWLLIAPFAGALALAAIVVTICYPLYEHVLKVTPRHNKTLASLLSVALVLLIVIIPLVILGSLILREALTVYSLAESNTFLNVEGILLDLESTLQRYIPNFTLDLTTVLEQTADFIASHLLALFAGTASTLFYGFIALIASFYFFRDGKEFTSYLVRISPLTDVQDSMIIKRLAVSVRSVALGSVFVALIQGTLTGIGLWLFGFDRAVLWGAVAAFGALIPGVGTSIVFIPAVVYLIFSGSYFIAAGVALWGMLAVGIIDNILGPYLMSRGNQLHPFFILISVLGGIALMGPIGFIIGPVILSFFMVMLELYSQYLKREH